MKKKISFSIIPAILLCGILPFIVRLHMEDIDLWKFSWFPNQSQWGDFFLYGKMQLFLVISVGAAVVLLDSFLVKNDKISFAKSWFLLVAYGVLCLLSAILSEYKGISFHGGIEQYESVWVLLGYCVICCYGFYIAKKKVNMEVISVVLVVVCILLGILGVSQLLHKDILGLSVMQNLLIPDSLSEYRESLQFNFSQESVKSVYMTFYNPNYAGVFAGMIIPVLVGIFLSAHKKWMKTLGGIAVAIQTICLFGSGSKSGIAALIIVGIIFGIIMCLQDRKKWKVILPAAAAFLLVWIGYDYTLGNQSITAFIEGFSSAERDYGLEDIQVQKDKVSVTFKGQEFCFWQEEQNGSPALYMADENGQLMAYKYNAEENACVPEDERLQGILLGCYEKEGISYIFLQYKDLNWLFTNETEDGGYTYITLYGKTDKIERADTAFSTSMDGIFTYRGYIWNRTLPLLKQHLLVGSGPDTFLVTFPQNDYVARAAAKKGFFTEILTRPHNMYLQTALQTGVLSLICLLGFVGTILYGAVKKIKSDRNQDSLEEKMLPAILGGILVYLISGIANDSTVTVAPFFWLLLGIMAGLSSRQTGK